MKVGPMGKLLRFCRIRWLGSLGVSLTPLTQITERSLPSGAVEYDAQGDDPQFLVAPEGGVHRLVPGWHLLTLRVDLVSGDILRPCLYPDYGGGCSEATRIPLPKPGGNGLIQSVILIKSSLRAVRFDPSIRPAVFRIDKMRFRRISRPRAFWGLLRGVRPGSSVPRSLPARLMAFAKAVKSDGLTVATNDLVGRYYGMERHASSGYLAWLDHFDPVSESGIEQARAEATHEQAGPLISVVLPVYGTPPHLLERCIQSVIAQTYPHWQLCIADDASPGRKIAELLKAYARQDKRIEVVFRERNGHICEATNSALALAKGAYVAFLDHDDELNPDALRQVVLALAEHPQARLVYTDEDKIDEEGMRFEPHFKPAWNPELLRSQNYICHLMVVDSALLAQVGGLRAGFEGSQDHDLVLRCTEVLAPEQICHIPRILYHWRAIAGSTALGGDQKAYASEAGRRAVEEHLQRIGRGGSVEIVSPGCYRSRLPLPARPPRVSVVIPTRDCAELLTVCVKSLLDRTEYPDFELIVVDNGSMEPAALEFLETLRTMDRVKVIDYPVPFNFSSIVNHGVRHSGGEVVCLLNNDTEITSSTWLGEMVSHAVRPTVGAVGAMLYYPDDTIQHAGVVLGLGGVAGHLYSRMSRGSPGYMARAWVAQNVSAVTGACLAVRRSVFDEAGGLDEAIPVAFNDVDFCIRLLELGYRNVWTPHAELYHHESASRGVEDSPEKQRRFAAEVHAMRWRWGELLQADRAYNPNLTLDHGTCGLAFPPRPPRARVGGSPVRI